eukprot:623037-Pyramimonas_sp.AAC.1
MHQSRLAVGARGSLARATGSATHQPRFAAWGPRFASESWRQYLRRMAARGTAHARLSKPGYDANGSRSMFPHNVFREA